MGADRSRRPRLFARIVGIALVAAGIYPAVLGFQGVRAIDTPNPGLAIVLIGFSMPIMLLIAATGVCLIGVGVVLVIASLERVWNAGQTADE